MNIQSIKGISQKTCACGGWLEHWKRFSGQDIFGCPVVGCRRTDLVGAHVLRAEVPDRNVYIYPLCTAHHQVTGILNVSDAYMLIAPNKGEACGKQPSVGTPGLGPQTPSPSFSKIFENLGRSIPSPRID